MRRSPSSTAYAEYLRLRALAPSFTSVRPSCYKLRSLRLEAVCWDMVNGIGGGEGVMKRPEDVTLRREDGEALIERLEKEALTA